MKDDLVSSDQLLSVEFSQYCDISSILQNSLYRVKVELFCPPFMMVLMFLLADHMDEKSMVSM